MADIEIKNAMITGVRLDADRCLSAWLDLDYGGSGQAFGGFILYHPPYDAATGVDRARYLGNYAGVFLLRCIQIGGVDSWGKLPGRTIRVKAAWTQVHAIGHIVKDDWFNPGEEFERIRALLNPPVTS